MKRMKLFSSLGALAVALCVLAFGVYAATTVTYNINATVTYTFTDAMVSLKSTIYGYNLTDPTTADGVATTIADMTPETVSTFVVRSFDNANKPTDPTAVGDLPTGVTIGENKAINDARDYNFNKFYLYKVVIEVTTPAGDGVTIGYTLPKVNPENATNTQVFIKAGDSNWATGTRLEKGNTATIEYYVGILAADISIGSVVPLVAGTMTFENPSV